MKYLKIKSSLQMSKRKCQQEANLKIHGLLKRNNYQNRKNRLRKRTKNHNKMMQINDIGYKYFY